MVVHATLSPLLTVADALGHGTGQLVRVRRGLARKISLRGLRACGERQRNVSKPLEENGVHMEWIGVEGGGGWGWEGRRGGAGRQGWMPRRGGGGAEVHCKSGRWQLVDRFGRRAARTIGFDLRALHQARSTRAGRLTDHVHIFNSTHLRPDQTEVGTSSIELHTLSRFHVKLNRRTPSTTRNYTRSVCLGVPYTLREPRAVGERRVASAVRAATKRT